MSEVQVIGEGIFGWGAGERRGDRYGAVALWESIEPDPTWGAKCGDGVKLDCGDAEGKKGKLRAVVLETRQSHHIGDMFHGLYPSTPEVGEVIELGVGTLFLQKAEWGDDIVGVQPEEDRSTFWMNPNHLYRAHDQTVRLEFVEGDLEMESWLEEKGQDEGSDSQE